MSSGGYLDKVGLEQDPKIRAFGRYGIRRRKLKQKTQNKLRQKVINDSGAYGGEWRDHSGQRKGAMSGVIGGECQIRSGPD